MLTLFRNNPGAMKAYLVPGNTGRFLGFLKSFVNALVEPFLGGFFKKKLLLYITWRAIRELFGCN